MFVFSLIGFYCFGGNSADPNFKDFHTSFVSMFVLITTANYPDVMMPAFNNSPYAFFFFLLYLGFGLFFLMNLVNIILVIPMIFLNLFFRYSLLCTMLFVVERNRNAKDCIYIGGQIKDLCLEIPTNVTFAGLLCDMFISYYRMKPKEGSRFPNLGQ